MRATNVFLLVAASAVASVSQAAVFQFQTATYYDPFLTTTLSEGSPTFTLLTPFTELNTQWLPNNFFYIPAGNGWVIDWSSATVAVNGQPSGAVALGAVGTLNNSVEVQAVGTDATVDTASLGMTATAPEAPENPVAPSVGQVVITSEAAYPVALGVASSGESYAGLGLTSGLGYALAESEVPEPSTWLLSLLGLLSVLYCVKRQQAHSR